MNTNRASRGFTLIEILIVLALMMIVATATFPMLQSTLNRSRLEGTARQTATLMRAARYEAIKRNCYGVVMIDPANRVVMAFADLDRDGVFEPNATPPDRLLGRVELPARIYFRDEAARENLLAVRDFDNPAVPVALPDGQAIFQQDGSVLATGALRFADDRQNYLEVNVEPRTMGRAEIRKYESGTWYANGDGGKTWTFL